MFIQAFRNYYPIQNMEEFASEIETKSFEEVEEYYKVFMERFRETKEKDVVLRY